MTGSRALPASPAASGRPLVRRPAGAAAFSQPACALLSLGCAAASAALALHHPLSPALATVAALAAALLVAWRPAAWLRLIPALLPLIGLAPWSGWLTFEELDILVLAVAAGGYLRLARGPAAAGVGMAPGGFVLAGLLLLAASVLLSTLRGMAEMGGPAFGWFQGYREPMNAVRLGKSFFLAALLLPLWRAAVGRDPQGAEARLAWGLSLGLAGAALAALWERLAFTGLLDFSSDYRTTALFWEMHVGGAAFDGFLALTVPFALHLLWHARGRLQWSLAAGLSALAGYVCLTTFSRAVYVALPVSLALMFVLHLRAARLPRESADTRSSGQKAPAAAFAALPAVQPTGPLGLGLALVITFAATAAWIFPGSGYRGMLAWLGALLLLPSLGAAIRNRGVGDVLAGVAGGLALAALVSTLASLLPKGPYLTYALVWLAAAVAVRRAVQARCSSAWVRTALAFSVATVVCTGLVIRHWGGATAFTTALPLFAVWPAALWMLAHGHNGPPADGRRQVSLAAALIVVATLVGVFSGGSFIGQRFTTGSGDLAGRVAHWQRALGTLRTPADWTFGHGLGTFPTRFFLDSQVDEQTGDWRVLSDGAERFAVLSGGKRMSGFNEVFRLSQRVAVPQGPLSMQFDARTPVPVQVHFEVCEKHLLYPAGCIGGQVVVPTGAGWTPVSAPLTTQPALGSGNGYAPRLITFSMAVETQGGRIEMDNLRLLDSAGRNLLDNGDFSADGAHWFFSSDRVHMPWHMKGLLPHQLHDQGLVGAALLVALVGGALWRLAVGAARGHALAPALAAALLGFLLVGVSDSLLDAPRVAFLFYLLLMVALTLPAAAMAAAAGTGTGTRLLSTGVGARHGVLVVAAVVLLAALTVPTTAAAAPLAGAVEPLRLRVGPGREIATLAEAARRVAGRTLIEVDAGDYRGDAAVAVWDRGDVTLRVIGGRVRLQAAGAAAEGKAIWVVRGARVDVQGFDFSGARVADANGAGIRFESGTLAVRDCAFTGNENGILAGNDTAATLSIEDSEFGHNGHGDGLSHNLYAGTIASLRVTGSWFHHADRGHLLKSRAARSHVAYNLLADGVDGRASYELEFPNGGVAIVIGNLIQQAATTDNPVMISYGVEGYRWPRNELQLVNNTLVDQRPGGSMMLRVSPGEVTVRALNNLLLGNGAFDVPGVAERNHRVAAADLLPDADGLWRLPPGSRWAGQAVDPGRSVDGEPLRPLREYRHPRSTALLREAAPMQPGALQLPARPPSPRLRDASVPTADPLPPARRARQP